MPVVLARARGRTRTVPVILAVTLLVALVSIVSRAHFIDTRPLAGRLDGQEPEAHIIVTELAFDQVSWRVHRFLPLFTLGARTDTFIDQHPGAAAPDALGNYYYTSTPPLTFVVPYLAAKLTTGTPTLTGLRWYNMTLGVVAALCLALLVKLCRKGEDAAQGTVLACTAAVIYLTAPECLKSHSIDLWAQQFTAVLLPLQVAALLFAPNAALLFALACIGCLADWTSYVANSAMIGLAGLSWWRTRDRRALHAALAIAAGSLLGGAAMLAWFGQVMSLHTYFHDLAARSEARSVGGWRTLYFFLPRYLESLGLFAFLGLAVLALRFRDAPAPAQRSVRFAPAILRGVDPLLSALLILGASLTENLLMKGHALLFSYDRLKGVQFLALLVVWCASQPRRAQPAYWSSVGVGLVCVALFKFTYDTPQGWNYIAHSQQERLGAIIARTAAPEGPAFFNGEVRGSEVYYAGRNVFELVDKAAAEQGLDVAAFVRAWCTRHGFDRGTVYHISGAPYPWPNDRDFPRTVTVTQVFVDGRPSMPAQFVLDERASDYHPPQSADRFSHLPDRFWK